MQWNALNATGVCSSSSAHRRFQERERAGVFGEIWRQGLLEYDEVVGIDWSFLAADGAMTRPRSAARRRVQTPLIEPKRVCGAEMRLVVIERGAHSDEPLAVIDQEPDVELDASELGDRQPLDAFPERRAGDGERVDVV